MKRESRNYEAATSLPSPQSSKPIDSFILENNSNNFLCILHNPTLTFCVLHSLVEYLYFCNISNLFYRIFGILWDHTRQVLNKTELNINLLHIQVRSLYRHQDVSSTLLAASLWVFIHFGGGERRMKMSSISLKAVGLSMRASTPLPPSIISLQMGNVAYREFSAANDFEQRTQEETYFL